MARLIPLGDEDVRCDNCDVIFMLVFQRNGYTERAEYCPFCGDEIDFSEPVSAPEEPVAEAD